jgi:hypothetical protein
VVGLLAVVDAVDNEICLTQRAREPVGEQRIVFNQEDTHKSL